MTEAGRHVRAYLILLVFLYASVLLAGPIAPYDPNEQNRSTPFAPPTRLHFVDADGRFHLRPFVYRMAGRLGRFAEYDGDRRDRYPVRVRTRGAPYRVAGMGPAERHLLGVA